MPISTESRNLLNKIGPETTNTTWHNDFYNRLIAPVITQFIEDDCDEFEGLVKIRR